ncbi:MutS-related protein [Congregibacter litoralis]|uniref:Mismatch repair ATPase (MutS family) n=1 Tax=Congregibacter litoralis KT71 TaxID=314285 RepID=A4A8G2_9GAMM|nr:DNA mismatch repair protein MutS [Congregibacter litoralis]EAQ97957.1 Mismatch repair ATPase (MutS family) [Congregibacter litoralis KT71]
MTKAWSRTANVANLLFEHFRPSLRFFSLTSSVKEENIEAQWSEPKPKLSRFPESTRTFYDLRFHGDSSTRCVDDRTWIDLDFDELFQEADITWTNIGRQFLYCRFRVLRAQEDLSETSTFTGQLQSDAVVRRSLASHLHDFGSTSANDSTKLIFREFKHVKIPKTLALIWIVACLTILQFALTFGGVFWGLLALQILANFFVSQWFEGKIDGLSHGYYELHRIAATALKIATDRSLGKVESVRQGEKLVQPLRQVRRVTWLTSFSQSSEKLLLGNAMYLVNLVTSIEFVLHPFLSSTLLQRLDTLKESYIFIGNMDSAIAIARYKLNFAVRSTPQVSEGDIFQFDELYHPLVDDPIRNTISLTNTSALITGSNMAGKTTLIKAVGINAIFAQTLHFCCAKRSKLPALDVLSSIKTSDSISLGKSYYFAELERILEFLNKDPDSNMLLLVDEIFRGTNTLERIAGSAAVLEELGSHHRVLVTSHDTELETFLSKNYEFYHFSETGNIEAPFDYVLRPGVCRTKNALKLMERVGYPAQVVKTSIEYCKYLENL